MFAVALFITLAAIHLGIPYWFPINKEKAIADNIIELNLSPDDNAYQIAIKAINWVVNDITNMWWSVEPRKFWFIEYSYCPILHSEGLYLAKKNDKIKLVYFL